MHLLFIEFAYNNSYQIDYRNDTLRGLIWEKMSNTDLLGRCRWEENPRTWVGRGHQGEGQDSSADHRWSNLEIKVGDYVFLKVSLTRAIKRFELKSKLSPHCTGPFEIFEWICYAPKPFGKAFFENPSFWKQICEKAYNFFLKHCLRRAQICHTHRVSSIHTNSAFSVQARRRSTDEQPQATWTKMNQHNSYDTYNQSRNLKQECINHNNRKTQ